MLSKTEFSKLTLQQKGEALFADGKYLTDRQYYQQRVVLYDMGDFFVECFYHSYLNKIIDISVPSDLDKVLNIYINAAILNSKTTKE